MTRSGWHTLKPQGKLSEILLGLRRAESAQRGYLFNQNPDDLDEFYDAEFRVTDRAFEIAHPEQRLADTPHEAAESRSVDERKVR